MKIGILNEMNLSTFFLTLKNPVLNFLSFLSNRALFSHEPLFQKKRTYISVHPSTLSKTEKHLIPRGFKNEVEAKDINRTQAVSSKNLNGFE